MNEFKNMHANGIDYFKLLVEIALCKRLLQSSRIEFPSDATELNVTLVVRRIQSL